MVDVVPAGRCTLTKRQSSVVERAPLVLTRAGQRLPYVVASFTPAHDGTGCGGCQRSSPTGAAAYRTPRKLSTPPTLAPLRSPWTVWTIGERLTVGAAPAG